MMSSSGTIHDELDVRRRTMQDTGPVEKANGWPTSRSLADPGPDDHHRLAVLAS